MLHEAHLEATAKHYKNMRQRQSNNVDTWGILCIHKQLLGPNDTKNKLYTHTHTWNTECGS